VRTKNIHSSPTLSVWDSTFFLQLFAFFLKYNCNYLLVQKIRLWAKLEMQESGLVILAVADPWAREYQGKTQYGPYL
jgi:hypothetical protein